MKNLIAKLKNLQTRIDALTTRERAILTMVIVSVIYMGWDQLLVTPLLSEKKQLRNDIERLQNDSNRVEINTAEIILKSSEDPDASDKRQLAALNSRISEENQKIERLLSGLMGPSAMVSALRANLQQQNGIELLSIKNHPVSELPLANKEEGGSGIFKHTTELQFSGTYAAILSYLVAIEDKPWHFHWQSLQLTMTTPPKAEATLTLFTLSLEKEFLGV
ncbi:MAG: type II secretion system protein M [Gammaproteobacteria bacterium]|nr:type II secretion system protein M [Gammaproteobacteria bacterium]